MGLSTKDSVSVKITTEAKEINKTLDGTITRIDKVVTQIKRINSTSSFDKQNKQIKNMNNSTNNLSRSLSNMSKTLKTISGHTMLGSMKTIFNLFSRFGNLTSKFIDDSASYAENLNLMQVAFKETGQEFDRMNESFVNGLSDAFGLDESVMTRQLGFYKQIGNALDIDNTYAERLAKNLLKMQLDMSSLYNLSFERSGEVLQASMAGQTKPIRGATGADITQATLQTDLDRLGIDEAISNLTRAEKVLLIYLSLERQLVESQGDLSKTINSTANQQKIFAEQSARLSRVLGDVLNPAFGKLLQVANGVLMVIIELVSMFAKLVGFELPTYETGTDLDWVEDLDTGLGSAGTKAKELKKSLRGFDKLNVINTPSSGGGAGGAGGAGGGVMSELLDHLYDYDLQMSKLDNKATQIRDKIMEWLGFTKEVNSETGEITWKYNNANKNLVDIAEQLGGSLAERLNSITDNIEWEKIGANIAKGLNSSLKFVNEFISKYDWDDLGKGLAKTMNKSIEDLDAKELGKTLVSRVKVVLETSAGFVEELDWKNLGEAIGETLSESLTNVRFADIINFGIDLFNGLVTSLITAVKNIDWGQVLINFAEGMMAFILRPLKTIPNLLKAIFPPFIEGADEAISKADLYKQKLKEMEESAQSYLTATNLEIEKTQMLENELSRLVDANGRVIAGNEDRVKVILSKLSNAIGIELGLEDNIITKNGSVIESYKDLQAEINNTIATRKKQAVLEAYEERYKEAVQQVIDKVEHINYLTEERKKLEEKLEKAQNSRGQGNVDQIQREIENLDMWIGLKEKELGRNQDLVDSYDNLYGVINSNIDESSEIAQEAYEDFYKNYGDGARYFLEKSDEMAQKTNEVSGEMKEDFGAVNQSVKDVGTSIKNVDGSEVKVEANLNTNNFYEKLNSIKNTKITLDSVIKFTTDKLNLSNIASSITSALPASVKKFLNIGGYANGGFPEDGWFRASKGELMGNFDDGTSIVANNRQVVNGVREMLKDGMMDALVMANNMNKDKSNTTVTIVAEDNDLLNGIKFKEKQRDRQFGF